MEASYWLRKYLSNKLNRKINIRAALSYHSKNIELIDSLRANDVDFPVHTVGAWVRFGRKEITTEPVQKHHRGVLYSLWVEALFPLPKFFTRSLASITKIQNVFCGALDKNRINNGVCIV